MAQEKATGREEIIPSSPEIAAVTTLEELLGCLLETIILATNASEGSLMLLHAGRELLTVNSARGPREQVVRSAKRHLGEGISGWVAKHKEPLLLIGPVDDPRFSGVEPGIKDAMCIPLVEDGGVIGVLSVSNKRGEETFSQADLERFLTMAQPSAKMIALTLAQRELDAESSAWARRKLAQEIHDGLLQSLSTLILHLQLYEELKGQHPQKAGLQLEESRKQALDCLQELRHLVFDLRLADLEQMSLAEELRKYVAEFGRRSNIDAHFSFSGKKKEPPLNVKKNLYRITQEALTNVRRHAQASRVDVQLKYAPHEMELTITDDGQGFRKEEVLGRGQEGKRFGLLGMQERTYLLGGKLEIKSTPGQGTTVRVVVPF